MRPTFEVIVQTLCPLCDNGSPNCSGCEEKDRCDADEGDLSPTAAEKIAALTAALEELTGMRLVMIDKLKEAER